LINASPAIVVAGLASGFVEGVDLARRSIDSGEAAKVLEEAVSVSRGFAGVDA
jgi:anthranilate phosphoribosyltransferase